MPDLIPCRCGGTPTLDASGAREIKGVAWQTWWASCDRCERSVAIEFDGDNLSEGRAAEAAVVQAWNASQA